MNKAFTSLIFICFLTGSSFTQDFAKPLWTATIYFGFGSWEIKNEKELLSALETLKGKENDYGVQLSGFTDTIGTKEYNLGLAEYRVDAVADRFRKAGIMLFKNKVAGESSNGSLASNRKVSIAVFPLNNEVMSVDEDLPAPAAKPEKMEVKVGIPTNLGIEFQNNSDIIMDYSYDEVDALYFALIENPGYDVELHGHVCCTDSYEISRMRAEAVKTALMRKGIDAARIKCFGHSNSQPLVPEIDEESEQRNRRVEAVFKEL